MKKKLIIATAIVLVLAICTTLLVGCDEIFKKNEKRDALQVVATVTYNGQTDNVYKFELATTFNNYAYVYVNYYGMSYEAAANYLAQSLAQQRLLTLFAKEKVAKLKGLSAVPANIADLLSDSEKNKAIEDSNDSMLKSLTSIVESLITEDNANSTTSSGSDKKEEVEVTEPVTVRFETNGASAIDKQKIQKGTTATEPTAPTKTGYTFYGWYTTDTFDGDEFDFDTTISDSLTLYARWEKYTAPRTERPEVEEEDDYDPDKEGVEISERFFSDTYKQKLLDDSSEDSLFTKNFLEADFADNVIVDEGETLVSTLKDYINEGLAQFEKNLKNSLYKDTVEECYEYYLNSQMQSLLVTRLQRMVGESVIVSEEEIRAEFESALAQNKETFAGSTANYESALKSSLDTTYYHPADDQGYGFVINILLKLDEDSVKTLTDMLSANPSNTEAILITRNRLIADMEINVSNPDYKANATIEDKDGNTIEVRDAMTDALNPYNKVGKTAENPYDNSYEYEVSEGNYANDYDNILSFEEVDGKFEIVFKAKQHPAMAYLLEKVPAFDKDGKVGVIHQIHNSFDQVKAAVDAGKLTKAEGVYWLREVATTWLYLVGDDSGALNTDSNNNGLGYLVSPEGKDSSFLEDFTTYARKLVGQGTGSYRVGATDSATFTFNSVDCTFSGDQKAFVVADSFIKSKSTSNAYAGVFVLLNSRTVWDATAYEGALPADGVLPMDYIVTYAKNQDDVKTIRDNIEQTLTDAKKTDAYNALVNNFANNNKDNVKYYEDVIKQLWKDLA
ncbi:MAG: InlB B-repeat-containing protein [Clostridiales bacterium]|nr:InlB B-repeat-containing protein [Clostridiales bacterium]MDY2720854.1 InlB B-repeat-containing protein [Eubacteriales bacterium]